MAQATEIKGTIAILGAAAAGVVAVLVGALYWAWPSTPEPPGSAAAPQAAIQQPAPQQSPPAESAPAKPAETRAPAPKAAEAPIVPSFDLVRVEPNGESVIAGRAAPGATIELLRGDQVHSRAVADASGLFAIVPPALPPGSHQIVLQSIAPDGARQRSTQSVTVVIDAAQKRPLVTLTTPDQPTVVLSNPEPPEPQVAQNAPKEPEQPAQPEGPAQPAPQPPQQQANAAPEPPAQPAPRPEIKIVSVETEEGKLFVSGVSAPGATVRLYLNDALIAPGGAGADGKVSFSIGSGVRPGDYRIRLDDVDPVSGQVKSRAEVAFNVPVQVASSRREAPGTTPPSQSPSTQGQPAARASAEAQVAAAGTIVIPNINTAIVSRGDNLWRISQRIYGSGYRYTVIYGANQDQIRNPDLIYPGQVFVLPSSEERKTN
ncbi:LysM peptidoglycan-binding domain-containing protein [Microvirga makkahensis]|uniref:LysM peptidoglycan-binding domain-containing protein n=1 Tax=Microvirga makkahensis TaxID=1128670 RepID=A0A7X3MT49_9HYPH|nr:LysM peptidoglycan-binding domain-containing protein [Microvirga makkahensis]MXQ12676.1 LysM peptidoglycan-binding domain-containing protein [Microvirga makkahensis]